MTTTIDDLRLYDSAERVLEARAGLVADEHGQDTPKRFLNMLDELTAHRPDKCDGSCIKFKAFDVEREDLIVIQDIPFVSVCNHHVIPFMGVVHIGYVPNTCIAGLSKFGRVVEHYARRLQVQERMTQQIAQYLEDQLLQPKGVAVVVKAEHLCMTIRGIQKPGAFTTTAHMSGVFGDHDRTAKNEFYHIINGGMK